MGLSLWNPRIPGLLRCGCCVRHERLPGWYSQPRQTCSECSNCDKHGGSVAHRDKSVAAKAGGRGAHHPRLAALEGFRSAAA